MNEIEATEITERNNLAVVGVIEEIKPIPGKDFVELVKIKDCGYTFICEKIHKINNLVVFIKYDTVVPDNKLFEFMKNCKFKVKAKSFTVKNELGEVIDKIYSQGIVLPVLKIYEYLDTKNEYFGWLKEGMDLTQHLDIKKYIPPVQGSGSSFGNIQAVGSFPTELVNKTDELNICSVMKALPEIKGLPVYITQKLEGSSLSCGFDNEGEFFVCSRNNKLKENDNKFWEAVRKNDIEAKLSNIPDIILQAELVGPEIQKNKLGLSEVTLFIFNMIDKKDRRRLSWTEMKDIATKYDIPLVPVCCEIESFDWDFNKLQEYSDIQKYENGELAEGIVIRPMKPFCSSYIKTDWSLKCINRNYKL